MTTFFSSVLVLAIGLPLSLSACDANGLAPAPAPAGKPAPAPAGTAPTVAARAVDSSRDIYKVPLGDSPARGGTTAKVSLVVFSEFQCPFCARVLPTLDELGKRYGDDLQIVWKHLPLPFHDRAMPAAVAAEAARAQGRFWPMHDRLFAEQTALGPENLERHARAIGLDAGRFAAAQSDAAVRARVDADVKLAESLGVRGTPSFVINGRRLVGAQPIERFAAVIDEELTRADAKLRKGVPRAQLYAALIEGGLDKPPPGEAKPAQPGPGGCAGPGNCPAGAAAAPAGAADDKDPTRDLTVHKVELGAAPARGPANAPVTVVVFSDFQCPFCKRIEATIESLEKGFPGKVRVVWKNFPLGFHANARQAAAAALVAHQSGKFWAMHDQLLANQDALDAAGLERHARQRGLERVDVQTRLAQPEVAAAVDADVKQGTALGVTGTPTVFVNGRRIVGAYPVETFRTIVEQELNKRGG